MSRTPKSPLKNLMSRRDRWLVAILLVAVLGLATLQLSRDLQQVNWRGVLAELPGISEENQAAASRSPDPVSKLTFIDDNYHRCQNKLGMELFWVQSGNIRYNGSNIGTDSLDKIMKNMFVAGGKYFTVHMYSYTDSDRTNIIQMVKYATNRQLTAILLPEVTGTNDADTLVNLYKAIAEAVPNSQFVGGSVPEDYMDRGDFTGAVGVANQVAEKLRNVDNVAVGTPVMFPDDDPGKDRLQQLINVGGLELDPFDFLLIKVRNSDYKFDGTWDPTLKYQSEYSQTGYFRFSEIINKDTGENHFRAKQWLRDNNNQDFRQHMQAIVLDFGLADNSYQAPGFKLQALTFQRLEDDFARFGADPDVRAVVLAGSQTVPYEIDSKGVTRLNLVSTNCNYNTEDSEFKYADSGTAPVCATEKVDSNTSDNFTEAPVVCDPDSYRCSGEIIYTAQVGLPIREFGSNSPTGTDTNPYMPISSVVGNSNYLNYLNPYNQYGQAIPASVGNAYIVPWLGSALYNSSELLRSGFYAANDPKLLAALPISDLASSAEYVAKLNSGYYFDQRSPYDYRTKTLWCFNGSRVSQIQADDGDSMLSLRKDKSPKLTADEFALYFGKGFCVTKDTLTSTADNFQSFDQDRQSNEFKDAPVCGNTVVKTDPQNMIYGAEQIVKKETWKGSGDDLCYDAWRGDRDLVGGRDLNCSLYSNPSQNRKPDGAVPPSDLKCDCSENTPEALNKCNIDNLARLAKGEQPVQCGAFYSAASIKAGKCTMTMNQVKFCMDYNGGAESLATSTVKLHKTNFPGTEDGQIPTYDVPGAYSALASIYKHVQDQLAQRGLKLVFKEDQGWQSDVIFRAYMTAQGPKSKIPQPRESLMLDVPSRNYSSLAGALGAATGQAGATGVTVTSKPGSNSSSSCKIGVNLAIPAAAVGGGQINEASDIGYGAAQVLITNPGDANDGLRNTLSQMCQKGITPVIRSCFIGSCGFSGGADQASTYNNLTDIPACDEIYVTCGHNEPITEYPAGLVAEGQWTRDCVRGVDTKGGKVKIAASIFNATYALTGTSGDRNGDNTHDVIDHAIDFISGYGSGNFNADKEKISCIGLNSYDVVSGSANDYERAEFYYEKTMTAVPEFEGMGGCVMETGSLDSTASGDMVDLVTRLGQMEGIQFMLGFNWMNTNPGWSQFAIDDKGRAAVQVGCEGASFNGEYLRKWSGYMANGKNWELYHQYYEMLGAIDELTKINDVLARTDGLSAGKIINSEAGGTARYQEYIADLFGGWYGCGSAAHKAFNENTNCIGLIGDRDPLGEFLCMKGYNVGESCKLTCTQQIDSGSVAATESTLKSKEQVQPGLLNLTGKIEGTMCVPRGILLALLEREITSGVSKISGVDLYQKFNPRVSSRPAWGPAQFTDIAWRTSQNPAFGKSTGVGFNAENGTAECLKALGLVTDKPDLLEEPDGDAFVLDRTVLGYALCGAAAKLKADSGTGSKCNNWTAEEIQKAATAYLGDCTENNRAYCTVYQQTMCNLFPEANSTLCSGSGVPSTATQLVCTPSLPGVGNCSDGIIRLLHPLGPDMVDARISQNYGENNHSGVDYGVPQGTPVYAAAAGKVTKMNGIDTGYDGTAQTSAGIFVKIRHDAGGRNFWTSYQHLSAVAAGISVGSDISAGQLIGFTGNTGNSTGPHLHFELKLRDDNCVDGYGQGYPLGTCTQDPLLYLLDKDGFTKCDGNSDPVISGDFACPILNPKQAKIIQSSHGSGSHSRPDQRSQLPTDIGAPNETVVSPVDGTIVDIRDPEETVKAFGGGICDYIRLPDGNPSNNYDPNNPDPNKRGINYDVIKTNNLEPMGGSKYGRNGTVLYDASIDDEGDYYYDGGFVVHIQDKEKRLWRLVHVKELQVTEKDEKGKPTEVTKGQPIGKVYDGTMTGKWAKYSVKKNDGSGCFSVANAHLHFAIIDAAAVDSPDYQGNTFDSTPWVQKYCGIN